MHASKPKRWGKDFWRLFENRPAAERTSTPVGANGSRHEPAREERARARTIDREPAATDIIRC